MSCPCPQNSVTALSNSLNGMQISGKFDVDGSGNVDFKEEDGIDYAPVTVQLPGGERVPFLFTIKELQAKVHPVSVSRWHLTAG